MSHKRTIMMRLLVLMLSASVLFFDVSIAQAADPMAPTGVTPDCATYVGLTNRIASCILATLHGAAESYFDGVYEMLSDAIAAFLTLGIAIYGVLAAAGMVERISRDTIMLILKIALIGFFTTHVDAMYDGTLPGYGRSGVIPMMDSTAKAVIGFTPANGAAAEAGGEGGGRTDFSQIKCMQNMIEAQAEATEGLPGPWAGIDCMIDSVIGIKVPPKVGGVDAGAGNKFFNDNLKDADKGMSRGLLYLFFSGMQSSVIGLLFAIIGFIFVYGLLHMILKALFIYIAGYIGITFLMILAPLFIPLCLFKQTKDYFDKWVKLIINFTLQPIIVLVFISFSIAAMDLATFSGDYSIMYRLAGDASRAPGFSLNSYLEEHEAITRKPTTVQEVKGDASGSEALAGQLATEAKGLMPKLLRTDCTEEKTKNDAALKAKCDKKYSLQWWHNAIDWEKLASARSPAVMVADGARTPGEQMSREVLSALIFCGIVVFIMNGLLQIVPSIVSDLLGDFGQSPNLFATTGKLPMAGGGIGGMANSLMGSMKNMVSGR